MNAETSRPIFRVQQEARGEWSVYYGEGYLKGPFINREAAQKWADDFADADAALAARLRAAQ